MSKLTVREIGPGFGAEVSGFDATRSRRRGRASGAPGAVRRAPTCSRFRDLDLTHAEQVRLSKMLIRDESADVTDGPTLEDKFYISNRGRTRRRRSVACSSTPTRCGRRPASRCCRSTGSRSTLPTAPTIFVSGTDAWKTLPDDLRARVERPRASAHRGRGATRRPHRRARLQRRATADDRSRRSRTPTRAPATTVLYVCEQMTKESSKAPARRRARQLLGRLFEHLYDPTDRWLTIRVARARPRGLGQHRHAARAAERRARRADAHAAQGGQPRSRSSTPTRCRRSAGRAVSAFPPFTLEGKVALVTGGGRGIGATIARVFSEAGAAVALTARSADQVEAVAAGHPRRRAAARSRSPPISTTSTRCRRSSSARSPSSAASTCW